jgi:oligoribonuclease
MDLEMTGLDPKRHVIVEIATLVTDDELRVIAEGPDLVVGATARQLDEMDEVVRAMHTRSGLLAAIESSTLTLADAGAATLEFLRRHLPDAGTVPLAGNSIGTDRRFLVAQLPEVDAWFHYRCVDVSTIKELCRRWYPENLAEVPPKRTTHRAMDDVREIIADLEFYRRTIFDQRAPATAPVAAPAPTAPVAAPAPAAPVAAPSPAAAPVPTSSPAAPNPGSGPSAP